MLSGSTVESDRQQAEALGSDGYMVKVPTIEKMKVVIADALKKH